jgi:hypothetical protein
MAGISGDIDIYDGKKDEIIENQCMDALCITSYLDFELKFDKLLLKLVTICVVHK